MLAEGPGQAAPEVVVEVVAEVCGSVDDAVERFVKFRAVSFRALCLTGDPLLRRTLRRTLQAAGSVVEFADSPAALVAAERADLVVLDRESRKAVDGAALGDRHAQVLVVGESIDKDDVLAMLRAAGYNHVVEPVDEALVVTSGKMVKADIFGLEKYLAWGSSIHERVVTTYEEKRNALMDVAEHAKELGVRRQVVARIESVSDELLMNALYDAPAIRLGMAPHGPLRSRTGFALGPYEHEPATLRWACDDRYFAVSVRDNYGELRKDAILDHIGRARQMRGSPQLRREGGGGGAGLGLYFVLASVTRFIANIAPGRMTEVIGVFDIKATGREQEACARSLQIFTV
jgi:CheY-like chemotaxis protein